jgi:hypothetical protein
MPARPAFHDLRAFVDSTVHAAFELKEDVFLRTHDERWSGIANGAAGVALFFLEVHRLAGTRGALERAAAWATIAERWHDADMAVFGRETARFGVAFGRGGIAYVKARVAAERGDAAGVAAALDELADAWRQAAELDDQLDAYDAAPGFLSAGRDLLDLGIHSSVLTRVGREAYDVTVEALARPIESRGAETLLGAAHGMAGALMAAIRWDASRPEIRATLDELIEVASTGEGFILWPRRLGGPLPDDFADSWCNGIAGFSLLLSQAEKAYGAQYAEPARAAAETVHLMRARHASVCCGAAGQAVSLYRSALRTKERQGSRRALARLRRAVASAAELSLDLMQGRLGVALVAMAAGSQRPPRIPILDALGPCC